jgi:hypothetical protein
LPVPTCVIAVSSRKNEYERPLRRLPRHHAHLEHGLVADVDIVLAHVRLFYCAAGSNKGVIPTNRSRDGGTDPMLAPVQAQLFRQAGRSAESLGAKAGVSGCYRASENRPEAVAELVGRWFGTHRRPGTLSAGRPTDAPRVNERRDLKGSRCRCAGWMRTL